MVTHVYASYDRDDFDVVRDDWLADWPRLARVRDYLLFARVLVRADIVSAFFDGGFLRPTPLAGAEVGLLHLAGCKLVVMPFGSDIAVRGHLGPTEAGFATPLRRRARPIGRHPATRRSACAPRLTS